MTDKQNVYATTDKNGKIGIIESLSCDRGSCEAYGCAFPDCGVLGDERFDTLDDAKNKYPNVKMA